MRACALEALPQLDDEDTPLAHLDVLDEVRLMRDEDERVTLVQPVHTHTAVSLDRLEAPPSKVRPGLAQHNINREDGAMVVVARVEHILAR